MSSTSFMSAKVLVIDDEPGVRSSIQRCLRSDTCRVLTAPNAIEGTEAFLAEKPDVVLCDVRLPDLNGLEAYDRMRTIDPLVPVIMMTAYAAADTAIQAIQNGAFEYLMKPLDLDHLRSVVSRAIDQSRANHARKAPAAAADFSDDLIVGRSPPMQEVYKSIGRVASRNVPVLITGESGTGKELVARAVFRHSERNAELFLAINCAAIPEALLESELFGHEKGAFTGADRRRIGKFEQADKGTIFLDEIGDMSPATQAKMLRLLQEQAFERVGGNETIRTDTRVIAATNQPLEELTAAGKFRQDLFYRLNVISIHLPPLRERGEDIPLLAEFFLTAANRELARAVQSFSSEAMQLLLRHGWPGNVRELFSTVKYAALHSSGDMILPEALPEAVREGSPFAIQKGMLSEIATVTRRLLAAGQPDVYHNVIAGVDVEILREVMRHTRGNQVEAAAALGLSRNTLRSKLKAGRLNVEKRLVEDEASSAQETSSENADSISE